MEAGGAIFMLEQQGGSQLAERSYLHVVLEPEWVPPGIHGQATASIQFGADVRTLSPCQKVLGPQRAPRPGASVSAEWSKSSLRTQAPLQPTHAEHQ